MKKIMVDGDLVWDHNLVEHPTAPSTYQEPFSNTVLTTSYTYRMSDKWVSSAGMSIDLGSQGNIGQRFYVTRIGESFLVSAGVNVDASRGNVGAHLAVEPRFLPHTRLGRAGGAQIPVAGAYGLE